MSRPWYADGLRFGCTRCGNCCRSHGEYTHVYLVEAEIGPLARALDLEEAAFRARYCDEEDGWTVLRVQEPACPFLGEDNGCTVYEARPMQCRTWPFWKDNLELATWRGPVKECCPGIDQGTWYSAEEVEAIAERNEAWYDEEP